MTTEFQATFYFNTAIHLALDAGELPDALRLVQRWIAAEEEVGHVVHLANRQATEAHVQFELGDHDLAERKAEEALETARAQRFGLYELLALWTLAYFGLERGTEAEARDALAKAWRFGRERGLFCTTLWRRGVIARLCARALAWDIEPTYAATLIRKHRLVAPAGLVRRDAWAWPLEVRTLGGLDIRLDGSKLGFGRKTPRRPLELLKLLVALGGRGVLTSTICDTLWPEAEGDAAVRSFQTTLHRLRAMLDDPALLVLEDGKLSLDAGRCWIDIWELEQLRGQPDVSDGERLLELCRGAFLAGDESAWCLPVRERQHRRFVRAALGVGGRLEESGRWEQARQLYERCRELAPSAALQEAAARCRLAY